MRSRNANDMAGRPEMQPRLEDDFCAFAGHERMFFGLRDPFALIRAQLERSLRRLLSSRAAVVRNPIRGARAGIRRRAAATAATVEPRSGAMGEGLEPVR